MPNNKVDNRHPKATRLKAISLLSGGANRKDISKELNVPLATVSYWAIRAGLSTRKSSKRRFVRRKVKNKTESTTPKAAASYTSPGNSVVAALITDPHLTDAQRVRMIAAYLNER